MQFIGLDRATLIFSDGSEVDILPEAVLNFMVRRVSAGYEIDLKLRAPHVGFRFGYEAHGELDSGDLELEDGPRQIKHLPTLEEG